MSIIDNLDYETHTIKWVTDEFKRGNLFVDETFQRNYIWLAKDRIALLETILLGYPIPEIYLWATGTDPTSGETKYSIIDGQQRIRSIAQFVDNELKLTSSGLDYKSAIYKGKSFDELQGDLRSALWGYKISMRIVKQAVAREDIVKMFLRLNKTSNGLNPQELRNAEFGGEFIKASEKIAEFNFWEKWHIFSPAEIRRMGDVQFASTLLIFVRSGFEDETSQGSINKMYDLLNESYPDQDQDIAEISTTLDFLDELLVNNSYLGVAIQRKTHLYSVFTLCYQAKRKPGVDKRTLSSALSNWFSWHEQLQPSPAVWEEKVGEYRRLSQEGVQKKGNRFRRYSLLAEYTGI